MTERRDSNRLVDRACKVAHACMLLLLAACDRPQANPYTHDGPFAHVAAGGTQTCALDKKGGLRCWGEGPIARAAAPTGTLVALAASPDGETACALDEHHALHCFGRCTPSACPDVPGEHAQVSVGGTQGCTIDSSGALHCWGWGRSMEPPGTFKQVDVGSGRACAVTTDKRVVCFGGLARGYPLPDGGVRWLTLTPPPRLDGHTERVSLGNAHACALLDSGEVVCFGDGEHGQLEAPHGAMKDVAARGDRSCAVSTAGAVHCWGAPLRWLNRTFTPPAGTFVEVVLGTQHACARKDDGAVLCWGVDQQSQVSGKNWQLVRN